MPVIRMKSTLISTDFFLCILYVLAKSYRISARTSPSRFHCLILRMICWFDESNVRINTLRVLDL